MTLSNARVPRYRDIRFDNLKGFLIVLVVLGHVLRSFKPAHPLIAAVLYILIYAFHMPAFVFISGYFSKPAERSAERAVCSVLLPFLVFHFLMWLLVSRSPRALLTPSWTMWYLLSLFFWKSMMLSLHRVRLLLTLSLGLALIIGVSRLGGNPVTSRTVAFFPYFVAGFLLDEAGVERIRRGKKLLFAVAMAVALGSVVVLAFRGLPISKVQMMKDTYAGIGLGWLTGAALRGLSLIVGFVMIGGLIAFAGEKQTFLTKLGQNSMTIYLGHSFVIKLVKMLLPRLGPDPSINAWTSWGFVFLLTASICVLFGNRQVSAVYMAVMKRLSNIVIRHEGERTIAGQ